MQEIRYGFGTTLARSGHASCFCAPLEAVVCFGGWPPSEMLARVMEHEGDACPLYALTMEEVVRGMERVDRNVRHKAKPMEAALTPQRLQRLKRLCRDDADALATMDDDDDDDNHDDVGEWPNLRRRSSQASSSTSASTTISSSSDGSAFQFSRNIDDDDGSTTERDMEMPDGTTIALPTPQVEMLGDHHAFTDAARSDVELSSSIGARSFFPFDQPAEEAHLLHDAVEVPGKYNTRTLQWSRIIHATSVVPRSRHGHHLVCCGSTLWLMGGRYWAHGDIIARSDYSFRIDAKEWEQIPTIFPPRFCASQAISNALPTNSRHHLHTTTTTTSSSSRERRSVSVGAVVYQFGGSDELGKLTNTLHCVWLPTRQRAELPQCGATPRPQFKGLLICDVQREVFPPSPSNNTRDDDVADDDDNVVLGRLFYVDGFQDGRPMAPALRIYNLSTHVWVKVCTAPDLVRSQLSCIQYIPVSEEDVRGTTTTTATSSSSSPPPGATRLRRFEMMCGMPARRRQQLRSRLCVSYDVEMSSFDFHHALPVPGLTAHTTVLMSNTMMKNVFPCPKRFPWLHRLMKTYHITALCYGGNEDLHGFEQNNLGNPVGWLYALAPRSISLSETVKVAIEKRRFPYKLLPNTRDELLDELF